MKSVWLSSRGVPPDRRPNYLILFIALSPAAEPGSFVSEQPCLTKGEGETAGTDLSRRGQERAPRGSIRSRSPEALLHDDILLIHGRYCGRAIFLFS
jgi:hypothetical protein